MGYNYKEQFQSFVINGVTEDNITSLTQLCKDFLENCNQNYTIDELFYLLNLVHLIISSNFTSRMLEIYAEEIKLKVYRLAIEFDNKPIVEKKCEIKCEKQDDNVYEDYEGFIIKKVYGKQDIPNLLLPEPGKYGSIILKNNMIKPGYTYMAEVEIDEYGKFVRYLQAPQKVKNSINFDEIDFDEIYYDLLADVNQYDKKAKE